MSVIPVSRCLVAVSLLAVFFVSGCVSKAVPPAPVAEQAAPAPEPEEPQPIPVIRHGRYALVELEATAAQRDLLLQVVEVSLPSGMQATVGDGLRHVLKRSGWRLCEDTPAIAELDALPLPAAHVHLGPMTLRDALTVLAGAAWGLRVDERARMVCFVPSNDVPDDQTAPDIEAAQAFPLAGAQP